MSKQSSGNKIRCTDCSLRDTQVSVYKNFLSDDNYWNFLDMVDGIGFAAVEAWGGGSFEAQVSLNVDPWEKLKKIRAHLKKTKLQILMRGQNILGYRPYHNDVLEEFIKTVTGIGVDIIRIFDGLNDIKNVSKAVYLTKKAGALPQVALSFSSMIPDSRYIEYIRELKNLDIGELYIKDSAGVITAQRVHSLLALIKEEFPGISLGLHSHIISGEAEKAYAEAVNSGADALDFSFPCFSIPLGLPSIKNFLKIPEMAGLDLNIDMETYEKASNFLISEIEVDHLKLPKELILFQEKAKELEMPRGEIFYLIEEIKRRELQDKTQDILAEIVSIRRDMGFPPMLMPVSHIVSAQALINIITGERYKLVSKEFRDYFSGYYGRIPQEFSAEVCEKISRPADNLRDKRSSFEELKKKIPKNLIKRKEDYLTYAMFPNIIPTDREKQETQPVKDMVLGEVMDIVLLKELMEKENIQEIKVEDGGEKLHIRRGTAAPAPDTAACNTPPPPAVSLPSGEENTKQEPGTESRESITAPITGTFYITPAPDSPPFVKEGGIVEKDKTICIIEAMKVMNEVKAPKKMRIEKISVKSGAAVRQNDAIFFITSL